MNKNCPKLCCNSVVPGTSIFSTVQVPFYEFLLDISRYDAAASRRGNERKELLLRWTGRNDERHCCQWVFGVWNARGSHVWNQVRNNPPDSFQRSHSYSGCGTTGTIIPSILLLYCTTKTQKFVDNYLYFFHRLQRAVIDGFHLK